MTYTRRNYPSGDDQEVVRSPEGALIPVAKRFHTTLLSSESIPVTFQTSPNIVQT